MNQQGVRSLVAAGKKFKMKGEKREYYKHCLSLKTKLEDRVTGDEVALCVVVLQVLEADFHVQLTAACRCRDDMSLYIYLWSHSDRTDHRSLRLNWFIAFFAA